MATPVCVSAPDGIVLPMPPGRTALRVELRLDEEPISGDLTDAQGTRTAFVGWTQLVSLIERARAHRPPVVAESAPPTDHSHPRRNT